MELFLHLHDTYNFLSEAQYTIWESRGNFYIFLVINLFPCELTRSKHSSARMYIIMQLVVHKWQICYWWPIKNSNECWKIQHHTCNRGKGQRCSVFCILLTLRCWAASADNPTVAAANPIKPPWKWNSQRHCWQRRSKSELPNSKTTLLRMNDHRVSDF